MGVYMCAEYNLGSSFDIVVVFVMLCDIGSHYYKMYHTTTFWENAHDFCFVVLCHSIIMVCFIHIVPGYFTGTGAII